MTNFISIFPLEVVVYPGETLNLHIFEARYKELINESYKEKKYFGIPAVINNKVSEMGTLAEIIEMVKVYDDGRMDIVTRGVSIFRILEIIKTIPDKLYSGAIVNHPPNNITANKKMMQPVIASVKELHKLLKVDKKFNKPDSEIVSYDVAHHAGLMVEEEYELLELLREDQRLEYLKRHLQKVILLIASVENMKKKIKLNGHFRELKGFDFL
ncbi:MAG: LON peptidase substrate-binding domain-containing protein [Parafilimonas sp.]